MHNCTCATACVAKNSTLSLAPGKAEPHLLAFNLRHINQPSGVHWNIKGVFSMIKSVNKTIPDCLLGLCFIYSERNMSISCPCSKLATGNYTHFT